MADKENKIVNVTFTYDIPDDYLYQTNDLGKTGTWEYRGPDKIWVFVDAETKRFNGRLLTEKEDGEHYPTPADQIKVAINCEDNPLLCSIFGHADENCDYTALEQHTEELPCGNVYQRPATPAPDHTYEAVEMEYDAAAGEFKKPYPWKKPHVTWEDIRTWRNHSLIAKDHIAPADAPQSVKDKWEAYRQELRDLPQVHGAAHSGETPTTDPWKVPMPKAPDGTS